MPKSTIPILSLFCLAFTILPATLEAQSPKFKISGQVADSAESKSIAYANVSIYKKGQPAQPLRAIYTDAKGRFQFNQVDTGNYTLIFTHAGLAGKKIDVSLTENAELGTIILSKSATTMKEITVYAQRPLVEQVDDKVIFNVENDPDSKSSNTLDIMRKTPLLSVDGDDNVQLNGQTNFKILLNGRETSMFARNVKEALKAFPGTLISKIEVSTTPPAKYDAEGIGGIINIITKKKVSGYNGSISTFNRTGAKSNNISTNLNVKTGKVGFSFNYFLDFFKDLEFKGLIETDPKVPSYFTRREVKEDGNTDNFYNNGNSELSWEIDSVTTLSVYGNLNGGNGNNYMEREITTDYPSSPSTLSTHLFDIDYHWYGNNIGSDYIRKSRKNKEKEFSVKFYGEFNKNETLDKGMQDNPGSDRFSQNNSLTLNRQYTLQTDYILPLLKGRKMELGAKAIIRNASSDFQSLVKYNAGDDYTMDPENSDFFKYTQDVYSVYNTYSFKTKKTTFRLGARLEHTRVNGDFVTSKTTVTQRYSNLIPNLLSTTKLNPLWTLVFSYTQRLQRPFIGNLNPFVYNADTSDIWYGNPQLKAQVQHAVSGQIRLQKGGSFASFGVNASYSNNMILNYVMFDPATGISRRTSDNIGKGYWINSNININTKFGQKWDVFFNSWLQYNSGKNVLVNGPVINSLGGGANGGATFKFSKFVTTSTFLNVNKPAVQLQWKNGMNIWYNTVFTFKLFKEKFNTSIRAVNFFHKTWNFRNITSDANFTITRTNTRPFRGFVFTMNYNFGKLKENVSKKRGVNNDDLLSQ